MSFPLSRTIKREYKIAVFDIETYNWVNPYAVGFFDGVKYYKFLGNDCIKKFLKFIIHTHKYRSYRIYAHNGGKFDFNFLMEHLKEMSYDLQMVFSGSRCILFKLYTDLKRDENDKRTGKNIITFIDSISLLKFSLDALTKDFNVTHKKLNFMGKNDREKDFEYLYKLYLKNDPTFHKYLRNDCIGLYEVLMKFQNLILENNGKIGMTIASTSLKTFQTGYLDYNLEMANKKTNDEMKIGYFGGRTEIFRMHMPEDKYRYYDVNSLYPYVMANNEFPISKPCIIRNPTVRMIKESCGITECDIVTPENLYLPVLPVRYNLGGTFKILFPLGKFSGYWDNVLLKKAMELGYKITPKKMFEFYTANIFKEYVTNFYRLKKNSKPDTPSYVLAKLMLNSLYGKFAQSQDSEIVVKISSEQDEDKYEIIDEVDPDFDLFRVKSESKGNFFLPQISIHVTALAQLRLYEFMEKLLDKCKILGYVDTDSICTNGYLPTSEKLGDMKKEFDFTEGIFLLPKTYCLIKKDGTSIIKAKGYIKEFTDQIHVNSFKKALFKNDYSDFDLVTNEKSFNPMKMSLKRHKTFLSTDFRKKSIKAVYDKRLVLKNFDTIPTVINGSGD